MIPAMMDAVGIAATGGPEMLRMERRTTPRADAGEVLVRVAAAGVNVLATIKLTCFI